MNKLLVACLALGLCGCGVTKDLGDGKVAGLVPVSTISLAASAAGQPGIAAGIDRGEAVLKSLRKARGQELPAPTFAPMTWVTNITVQLTNDTWIASEQIRRIRRELVPVPPAPIVEEYTPGDVVEQVAVGKKRTQDINEVIQAVADALMASGVRTSPVEPSDVESNDAADPDKTTAELIDEIIKGSP